MVEGGENDVAASLEREVALDDPDSRPKLSDLVAKLCYLLAHKLSSGKIRRRRVP